MSKSKSKNDELMLTKDDELGYTTFNLKFVLDVDLDITELWPDEWWKMTTSPTVEDVKNLIVEAGGLKIIDEWNLLDFGHFESGEDIIVRKYKFKRTKK